MNQSQSTVSDNSVYIPDYHTTIDLLEFSAYTHALLDILREADTPLTVGVFGPWGSGKTSLMRMLKEQIDRADNPHVRTVWFTAWKYDRQEALWRSFILRVLDGLYPRQSGPGLREERPRLTDPRDENQKEQVALLQRMEDSVYQPVSWQELGRWTMDWLALAQEAKDASVELVEDFLPIPGIVKRLLKLALGHKAEDSAGISGGLQREVQRYHMEQLTHMEQFEQRFAEALEKVLKKQGRLIVFVDDLDRCMPENAVEVLEAIKLFLEAPGTVFVLGMDREVVERGVEARYGALFRTGRAEERDMPISGDTYLQKIVQIPFQIPQLEPDEIAQYIAKLDGRLPVSKQLGETTRAVFSLGLYPNPRQVKRALNVYRLLQAIAGRRQLAEVAWPLLAKTVVIQAQYPRLYQNWRRYPTLIQLLEAEYTARPANEEEMLRGRVAAEGEVAAASGDPTIVGILTEPEIGSARRGGLLDPYLEQRQRYALLERMLRFPALDEAGEGREQARFAGLSRAQLSVYLRLAGAVEVEKAESKGQETSLEPIDAVLSGDRARIYDAVRQWQGAGDESVGAILSQLVREMGNEARSPRIRAGIGYAVDLLGDPRDLDEMMPVPVGPFTMGSSAEDSMALDGEKPPHEVFVDAFRISKYPVTNDQYAAFVAATYDPPRHWNGREPPAGLRTHPVVNVSWHDAQAYCAWLSEQRGEEVRLPTEAEWEKAARGTDARIYPWGNEFDAHKCNMRDTGINETSPVGIFTGGASPYGCLDMAGNVWEWTNSLWGEDFQKASYCYPYDAKDGRENLDAPDSVLRVLRGGSFDNFVGFVRCACRFRYFPDSRHYSYGFRVVSPGL